MADTPTAVAIAPATKPTAAVQAVATSVGTVATPVIASPTTASPPAVSAAGNPSVKILDQTEYADSIGIDHVIGVIQNTGTGPVDQIKVVASWNDASGATVATGDDNLLSLVILAPGQKAPFDVDLLAKAPVNAKLQMQTQAASYDPNGLILFPPAQGLTVEGDKLGKGSFSTTVTGRVVNKGKLPATLVGILVIGYDAKGKVIDVADGSPELDPIAPGANSPFSVDLRRSDVKVAKYELLVRGVEK
ncbi:MAG: FxLYD domain-containing protein [Chloroflexia bacterium]